MTTNQSRVDALLPAFLLTSDQDAPVGTRWTNVADLAFNHQEWDDREDRSQVGFLYDLAPGSMAAPAAGILPRSSTMRLLKHYTEVWGYGYVAGSFFDFLVEDGPLAGMTVTIGDHSRFSWATGAGRRTLVSALIAAAESPDIGSVAAARRRYDTAIEVLQNVQSTARPDGLAWPLVAKSDGMAIGER